MVSKTTPKNIPALPQPRTAVIRINKKILEAIAAAGRPYGYSAQRSFNLLMDVVFTKDSDSMVTTSKNLLQSAVTQILEDNKK